MAQTTDGVPVSRSPFLSVEEVAERLRCSTRTVYEMTRSSTIPHRRFPGGRRCLFIPSELEAWEDGAPLETTYLPRGGRVVRPAHSARTSDRRRGRLESLDPARAADRIGDPPNRALR